MWGFHMVNRYHVTMLQLLCILSGILYVRAQYTCEVGQERTPDKQWRWVLPYEHPCKCSRIRCGGTNTATPQRPFEPIYVEKPLVSDNLGEIRDHYGLNCIELVCPAYNAIEELTDPGQARSLVKWEAKAIGNGGECLVVDCVPPSGSKFSIGKTNVNCSIEDEKNNERSCAFQVSVIDKEEPEFKTCPLAINSNTDPGQPTAMVVWNQPEASDNSGKVTVSCNYKPGTDFPIGDALVNCTALDGSGNKKDSHFIVSAVDNEKPYLENCPSSMTKNTAPGLPRAVVVWTKPEARDNSGKVSVSCNYESGAHFNIGDTMVDCIAVDESGNENICYFTVRVEDNEKPELESCPLSITQNTTTGIPTAVVAWTKPEARNNSGTVSVSCSNESGASFTIGDTVVECVAVDENGNDKKCSFTVSIGDNEKPELEGCPSNIAQDTDPELPTAVVVWTKPEARDNSGTVSVSCSNESGASFTIGDTVVECVAVDENGNDKKCSFTVNIRDNEKPELEGCPSNITQDTDPELHTAVVVWTKPKARDNSGTVSVSCRYESEASFTIGDTVVECVAVDESGNENKCSFTVSIGDNERPELESCPSGITPNTAPGLPRAVVVWTKPEARDNSGKVSVSCNYESGAHFNIGDTMVDCIAVDESGNENICYFTVRVEDNEAPKFENCPSVPVQCADPSKATTVVVWPELQAHDNAGETSITCRYNSGAEFDIGDTMVECRAIDRSGNEKKCHFTVSVADNCGACWTTFQNHHYFVTCAKATFDNAQKACKQMGAELASIHNQHEQDFIGGYTRHDTSNERWGYWIGLVNRGASSDFIWTDGTPADFKNWNTGEPNLESEECGQMVPRIYHKWNDCPCSWELGYVCKKQTKRK